MQKHLREDHIAQGGQIVAVLVANKIRLEEAVAAYVALDLSQPVSAAFRHFPSKLIGVAVPPEQVIWRTLRAAVDGHLRARLVRPREVSRNHYR